MDETKGEWLRKVCCNPTSLKPMIIKKTETKKTLVDFDQRKITCFFTKNENGKCFQNAATVNHFRMTTADKKLKIILPTVSPGEPIDSTKSFNVKTKCQTTFNEFRDVNSHTEAFPDKNSLAKADFKSLLPLNSKEGTEKNFLKQKMVCVASEKLREVNDNVRIAPYYSKNEDTENEQPSVDFMDTCNISEELCLEAGDLQPFVPKSESLFTQFSLSL